MQQYNQVVEASYLTVEKAWSYRAILRYFYQQHERMREFLFPEEVYEYLKTLPDFVEYTEDELHQDLDQLVRWNNLIARQETGRAQTIEEFKKKRYRYQCTPYTVEFERMLQKMEGDGETFGGSLEKREFERLYEALLALEKMLNKSEMPQAVDCFELWEDIFNHFQSITKNTSDYMAHINSDVAEEQMQTEAFFVFKDQFTKYLRDFIIELQRTALKIQQLLQAIDLQSVKRLIKQVVKHQQSIPRFSQAGIDEQESFDKEQAKWTNLTIWFLGNEHGESELDMLQFRTNEQIRRMTRIVQRLGERHHYHRSRKKDYLHLAEWFASLPTTEQAHELASVVFGLFETRHLLSHHVPTDDIYTSIWDEAPIEFETNPRIIHYRARTRPGAVVSQAAEKERTKREFLQNQRLEQMTVEQYITENEINLATLPVIEPYVRKMFLTWIGKAMARKDRTFQTEYGRTVKVILNDKERITLRATDGALEMPQVVFRFVEEVRQ
ncbi:MAG TPA: TIGR02677 family protein [Bacillota bacterium]|nr:TIGR02677 family protein [Bacillota bacterium]